jgi:hypothetical protein
MLWMVRMIRMTRMLRVGVAVQLSVLVGHGAAFLLVCDVRDHFFFPRLGARCESALPAAVLLVLLVRPSRSTLLAAFAALDDVLR